ncbi:hypothetical protein J3E69DRAFT_276060 [Trichoderma sp. SZMC 28015]
MDWHETGPPSSLHRGSRVLSGLVQFFFPRRSTVYYSISQKRCAASDTGAYPNPGWDGVSTESRCETLQDWPQPHSVLQSQAAAPTLAILSDQDRDDGWGFPSVAASSCVPELRRAATEASHRALLALARTAGQPMRSGGRARVGLSAMWACSVFIRVPGFELGMLMPETEGPCGNHAGILAAMWLRLLLEREEQGKVRAVSQLQD